MKMFAQNGFVKGPFSRLLALGVFGAGVLVVYSLGNRAAMAAGANACKGSTKAASKACIAAAKSDKALAVGKCANIGDIVARKACQVQAKADLKDALDDCKAQSDARLAVCARLGRATYQPSIVPSNFVGTINNPFLPLVPGTTLVYLSPSESNVVFVTHNTKIILGVTCVEVHDSVYTNGELTEDTLDWYAQDTASNVWYFGENSKEMVDGLVVSLEGSWIAGVDGAQPGIVMRANPMVGDYYRQEFSLGNAEDLAEVTGLNQSANVPAGVFNGCLQTDETTPLEPEALEHKFYAPGVGFVLSVNEENGERLELVQVITPP